MLGAIKAAINPPFIRVRIEVDGHVVADFAHPILMAAIGNGSRVGGGARITPEADPGDGKLDVMVSFSTSLWAKLGYAVRFRLGTHHDRDDVLYVRGESVTMSGQTFHCSADGELLRSGAAPHLAHRAGGVLDAAARRRTRLEPAAPYGVRRRPGTVSRRRAPRAAPRPAGARSAR